MRILFLTQLLPYPPDSGPKIRMYYMLRYLAEQHQVTLVALVRGNEREEDVEHLRGSCEAVYTVRLPRSTWRNGWFLIRSLLSGQPFTIVRDWVEEEDQLLDRLLSTGNYDAFHADQLYTAQYGLSRSSLNAVRTVVDKHNAYFAMVQRLADVERNPLKRRLLDREARLLADYEAEVCRSYDHVLTVTEHDREVLGKLIGEPNKMLAVPICVDTELLQPVERVRKAHELTMVGSMFYPPNVDGVCWFIREVYPLVQAECPEVKLNVIGARPAPAIRQLAANHPTIRVTGYVDDLTPYLQHTAAMIVPLRSGSGMRVKIVDALARGVPVVSTTVGAEGLDVIPDEHLLIVDRPADFAEAVLRLLRDPDVGEHLARAGRRLAETRYDWRHVYTALDEIYASRSNVPTP